jgi:iron complex outermembrane receptor protein
MLVLIDGRSVYTPLFSGTYWDEQDVVMEDIERIEVIRGPGATMWGANAVNGVINVITKNANSTQGNFISGIYGNEERGNISSRHGGKIGKNTYYRIYNKYFKRDESKTVTDDTGANNEWEMTRSGFRIDTEHNVKNNYTIQGDIYSGYNEAPLTLDSITNVNGDEDVSGGNLMFKWSHAQSNDSIYDLKVYSDYTVRDIAVFKQDRKTLDIDFQHIWKKIENHEVTWGLGYRIFNDELISKTVNGISYLSYNPEDSYNNLYSSFIQDKISIVPNTLYITLGSKFEHNFYTDFEVQPNARITWLPNDKSTIWAAVSRAVRIPSRAETSINVVAAGTPPFLLRQVGNEAFNSEKMIAYELGYRIRPKDNLSFDITTFFNDYDNLRSLEPNGTLTIPVDNKGYAETYGIELSSEWNVTEDWTLVAAYNYLKTTMHVDLDSTDSFTEASDENASPHNQFKLRSHLNLKHNVEFDNILYFVDNLSSKHIENYIRFDTRLSWKPNDRYELSLVGQNLFDDSHPEFSQALYSTPSAIGRSAYVKVKYNF